VPAVSGGVVLFGSDDGKLYAADVETGKEKWRFAINDEISPDFRAAS
jgi:outer membrane protein assembly factor BamB